MNSINKARKLLLATVALCLVVPGIQAADIAAFRSQDEVVSIANVDLSRDDAVVALYQELRNAAVRVCGKDDHGIGARIVARKLQRQAEACVTAALDNAVQQINNQRLTSLHNQANSPRVVSVQ